MHINNEDNVEKTVSPELIIPVRRNVLSYVYETFRKWLKKETKTNKTIRIFDPFSIVMSWSISYLPTVQFLEGLSSFWRFQILKNWTVQFFLSFSDVKFNCKNN